LGASNDVFHSLFDWFKHHKAYQKLKQYRSKPRNDEPWEVFAEYERAKNLHSRSLDSVWIRVGSALLVTAAVAIWSFCPPSLIITICCVVFISLIAITSKFGIWSINETSARLLQKSLKKIAILPQDDLCPKDPEHSDQMYPSAQSLRMKEDRLNRWEQRLLQEEHPKSSNVHHSYQSTSLVLLGLDSTPSTTPHPNTNPVPMSERIPKDEEVNPDVTQFHSISPRFN
jgi:hypothetical protein